MQECLLECLGSEDHGGGRRLLYSLDHAPVVDLLCNSIGQLFSNS